MYTLTYENNNLQFLTIRLGFYDNSNNLNHNTIFINILVKKIKEVYIFSSKILITKIIKAI